MTPALSARARRRRAATRLATAGTALCLLAAGAAGCGSDSGDSDDARSIKVGVPPNATGMYINFAADNGFFDDYDLKVTTVPLNGGAAAVPALESNSIQIGQSNVLSVIQGASQGLDTPCFSGANSVVDEDDPLPLVAGADSDITGPEDLDGKTIAVNATGGIFEVMIASYLDSEGVDPSSVKYVAMPFGNMAAALASGQVDAAGTAEPFASQMVAAGGTKITGNLFITVEGQPEFSCYNATSKWLKENPDVAADFVAGWAKAAQAITDDPAKYREYLKQHDVPAEVADKFGGFSVGAKISDSDVTDWITAAQKYKILTGDVDRSRAYFELKG